MDCFTSYTKTKLKTTIISGLFISCVQERSSIMGRYRITATDAIEPELLTAWLKTMKRSDFAFRKNSPLVQGPPIAVSGHLKK
jgi:hypothetical protein